MKILQCKVAISSGYYPQTDGQSERFHRSVEYILRYHIAPNQQNYIQVLQQAAFALNSSMHTATHLSPFKGIYSVEPVLPIDLAVKQLPSLKI